MPQISGYTISRPLANFALGYQNGALIHERLFPVKLVDELKGFYWKFGKEAFTPEDDYRAPRSRANMVDHDFTRAEYSIKEHALNHDVAWEERDAAARVGTPMDPYQRAARIVRAKLDLGRELAVATMVRSTTNLTSNVTLSGTSQWSSYANANTSANLSGASNPLSVAATARNTIRGAAGNTQNLVAVIPYAVFEQLRYHPTILEQMTITATKILTQDLLATILGVNEVIVPEGVYNTANPGQTPVMTDIWGKDVIFTVASQGDPDMEITLGRIFRLRWESVGGAAAEVRRWTEADRKTDVVEVGFGEDRNLIAPDAAYLVKNAIA